MINGDDYKYNEEEQHYPDDVIDEDLADKRNWNKLDHLIQQVGKLEQDNYIKDEIIKVLKNDINRNILDTKEERDKFEILVKYNRKIMLEIQEEQRALNGFIKSILEEKRNGN